jgi:TPR repeat protein
MSYEHLIVTYNLGRMYKDGKVVERDYYEAFKISAMR